MNRKCPIKKRSNVPCGAVRHKPNKTEQESIDLALDALKKAAKVIDTYIDVYLEECNKEVKESYLLAVMAYVISDLDEGALDEAVGILKGMGGSKDPRGAVLQLSKMTLDARVAVLDVCCDAALHKYSVRKVNDFLTTHAKQDPANGLELLCFCIRLTINEVKAAMYI